MKTVNALIEHGTILIHEQNVDELNNMYNNLLSQSLCQLDFDIGFLFQKLFLKACLYGNIDILYLFFKIYEKMPDIPKITQWHSLVYGKYLVKTRKDNNLLQEYNKYYESLKNKTYISRSKSAPSVTENLRKK